MQIRTTIVLACVLLAAVALATPAAHAQLDPPGTVLFRVNSGGPQYTDTFSNIWSADSNFNTGNAFSTGSAIQGTTDSALFQSERWDDGPLPELTYSFPVSPGTYTVKLFFAEIYQPVSGVGQRVFHVDIEGARVLQNFDMALEAPFLNAITKQFSATVTDGSLDITLVHVTENPKISAIAISTVLNAPVASASPASIDFGSVLVGTPSAPKTVTIANNGDVNLDIASVSVTGAGAAAFSTDAVPPYSVVPGGSISFNTVFQPNAAAPFSGNIVVGSNDPNGDVTIPLSGVGALLIPIAVVTPANVDFGQTVNGTTSNPISVTIANVGQVDLIVSSIAITGANANQFFTAAAANYVIAPGASANFDVAHTPNTVGLHAAQVVVTSNDAGSPAVVTVTGESIATPPALYRLNVGGPNYTDPSGNLWQADAPFVNTGNTFSTGAAIAGTTLDPLYQSERWDDGPFPEMTHTLPLADGSYIVRLHFAEIYSGAAFTGGRVFDVLAEGALLINNVDIFSSAGFQSALVLERQVNVTGGALNITLAHQVENPKMSAIEVLDASQGAVSAAVTPSAFNFGNVFVGLSAGPQLVAITNTGLSNLVVQSVQITGAQASDFVLDALSGYVLAPGQSVTPSISFVPSVPGAASSSLEITTSASGLPIVVPLQGMGVAPGVPEVAPLSVNFGAVTVGATSLATTLTVTNNDIVPHQLDAVAIGGANAADFLLSTLPTLPVTLASGTTTTVGVTFAPALAGLRQADVTFHLDDATAFHSHLTTTLSGTGSAPAVAVVRLNAGGPEYTDPDGNLWLADQFFVNTGNVFTTSAPIANTNKQTIYKSERWDSNSAPEMLYAIGVNNGSYLVRLHFSENYSGAASIGARVFDVKMENVLVLNNYDIFKTAGFETAQTEEFVVDVVDGSLDIEFLHVVENPKISAIEVLNVGMLTPDAPVFDWGHVVPNTIGAQQLLTLTNTGGSPVSITGLTFTPLLGNGAEFKVTLGGITYTGDTVPVTYPVNIQLGIGASTVVPMTFEPTASLGNDVQLSFTGTAPPAVVRLLGTGDVGAGDPFLHVVINVDPFTVDYDEDGTELVDLVGSFSHTHEIGHALTAYEWREGATLLSSQPDVMLPFAQGPHTVSLTIIDDNLPPRTLTDSKIFSVVAPGSVPGAIAHYYVANLPTVPNDLLDAVPANPEFVERLSDLLIVAANGTLGSSPYSGSVMVQMLGQINVATTATYAFQAVGGNETRLFVDGVLQTVPVSLAPGIHSVEARFAVDLLAEAPLQVLMSVDGGAFAPIDPALLTHDERLIVPVINSMPGGGLPAGGNTVKITGLGFFPDTQVSVNWGGTILSGAGLIIQPNEISFVAPAGAGTIGVFVQTPNGQSNVKTYTYSLSGPAPVVFNLATFATGLVDPTTAVWGSDGRLYVGTLNGKIHALTLDDNLNVIGTQVITTLTGLTNHEILGLTVNPFDPPGTVKLYVAHSQLFANGGSCFSGSSPYNGQISVLTGPSFNTIQPLVTNLPVSNHDHGVNALEFDNNGDLLVAIGGNTNVGILDCALGGIPESPLSAAIIKVETSKPGFNGAINYVETASCVINNDQVFGDIVDVQRGVDVSVFAAGLRNTLDFTLTTSGKIYATDNGANIAFGDISTGPTTQTTLLADENDKLVLIDYGRYYGHPNRNVGRYDQRQNVFHDLTEPSVAGVFEGPLTTFTPSTNGVIEYRASTFNNAMRGDLIAQKWNGTTYRVDLSPDGTAVVMNDVLFATLSSLNLAAAPGGVIIGIDFSGGQLIKAIPEDIAATGLTVYDIFPWRAPATGGYPFVIGGAGFGTLGDTSVTIGGVSASLTSVSPTRIEGAIPAAPFTTALQDIVVSVGAVQQTLPAAFRYLSPAGPAPSVAAKVVVEPPFGSLFNASTFDTNSFLITNQSTLGQTITRIRFNLATSVFSDMVLDPFGTGGDNVGKPFTADSGAGTGLTGFIYANPRNGGYDALELSFNSFGPGETFGFSIDVDPNSIEGSLQPGPGGAGHINGLELMGAEVYIEFDDDSTLIAPLFRKPVSVIGSQNTLKPNAPPVVEISTPAITCKNATVATANHTVTVSGPPGTNVVLMVLEAGLFIDGTGPAVDPYDRNRLLAVTEHTATIGAGGTVGIPIVLTRSDPDGGLNILSAAAKDALGDTGPLSETLVLEYTP